MDYQDMNYLFDMLIKMCKKEDGRVYEVLCIRNGNIIVYAMKHHCDIKAMNIQGWKSWGIKIYIIRMKSHSK